MLDNFQLIPGEAFTAIGRLGEKLIDKLSDAVGFIATPKGNRKNIIEAEQFLIDQIKADDGKPYIQKAAEISNARRLIREYNNQNDIVNIAIQNLGEDAMPENIDVDWLAYFMDRAKNISTEDMQIIWGKILAKECESEIPGTLINVLSLIDKDDAETFRKLCGCCIEILDSKEPFVVFDSNFPIYLNNNITLNSILSLQVLGLVCISENGYGIKLDQSMIEWKYFGKKCIISRKNGGLHLWLGNVQFTKAGKKLSEVIVPQYIDGLMEVVESVMKYHV